MTIEELISVFASWAVNVAARLVLTLVVLFVGFKVAKIITKIIDKSKNLSKIDPGVKSFVKNSASIGSLIVTIVPY